MKGQDVMTSNVACQAMLWTENSNEHPKTRDQQKHDSGAPRAKRTSGAPWVNKSTHPRKSGNHVTDRPSNRPTVRPHHRYTNIYSHTF